jgi:2-hydroxychromene-2-carboxylate isomerase
MSSESNNLEVDVYWSMRSPYCYISLNRCLEMQLKYHLDLNLNVTYPDAIKEPEMFTAFVAQKYRIAYQDIDSFRNAYFHGIPMRYPVPDVVVQHPDKDGLPYGEIATFEEQIYAHFLTRHAIAASDIGKGWEYLNSVMRMVWNGQKRPWATPDDFSHVIEAINAAGIDADKLMATVATNPEKYDERSAERTAKQESNDAKHGGVPNFIFQNEPFFGQDRINLLIWRLKQHGLREREDYKPSTRAQGNPNFWG